MVGNLAEWVADWVPLSTHCPGWGGFSDDAMCLSGASEAATGPGALVRGGAFTSIGGTTAGPLHVHGGFEPGGSSSFIGFRCVREAPPASAGLTAIETPTIDRMRR
jgi:formylglycine-generating enzyme required for sulfatase activity